MERHSDRRKACDALTVDRGLSTRRIGKSVSVHIGRPRPIFSQGSETITATANAQAIFVSSTSFPYSTGKTLKGTVAGFALRALPLAVTVDTAHGWVGIIHCSTWRNDWSATLDMLEERNIDAINMVLLGIDENDKRAGPTGNEVVGIDYLIAGHDPRAEAERRGNLWYIDTRTGFPAINRLTLARIDVDPPELKTFEVREG